MLDYLKLGIPSPELPLRLVRKNKFNKVLYAASTNNGGRFNNEDYYKIIMHPLDSNLLMTITIAGVGGYSAGEIASLFVSKKLAL